MGNFVSLIIDIEESRSYSVDARNDMQKYIADYMKKMNILYKKSMEFEVVFSAGDEFQGLFHDITSAFLYLRLFEMLIWPVKIRAGLGIGEWNIKLKNGVSTQQDGPAYHRARQAIDEVEKKQTQRYRIKSDDNDDFVNNLINASLVLKDRQGNMQNITLLIIELLYPFEKYPLIKNDKSIVDLLNMRYEFKHGVQSTRELELKINVIDPISINGERFDAEEVIIKKNMSSHIAKILDCKRQNADMLIKRGNSLVIRSMDYTALQYLERKHRI